MQGTWTGFGLGIQQPQSGPDLDAGVGQRQCYFVATRRKNEGELPITMINTSKPPTYRQVVSVFNRYSLWGLTRDIERDDDYDAMEQYKINY